MYSYVERFFNKFMINIRQFKIKIIKDTMYIVFVAK